jgi:type III pantothenate kinase
MHILGDIGNTDTKLFLVSTKNKIIKKITFQSKNLNQKKLSKYFSLLKPNYQKINKILFCSVVPKSFNLIKKFLSKKTKINCYEVKNLEFKIFN